MPIIPNNYQESCDSEVISPIDKSFRPFMANDGMVPLTSALLLEPGALDLFQFRRNGKLIYNKGKFNQLCQVKECIVLSKATDHLGLLDDNQIVNQVIQKLKSLD